MRHHLGQGVPERRAPFLFPARTESGVTFLCFRYHFNGHTVDPALIVQLASTTDSLTLLSTWEPGGRGDKRLPFSE